MAWQSVVSGDVSFGNFTTPQVLSGEQSYAHVQVERLDAGSTDRMVILIQTLVDDSLVFPDDVEAQRYELDASEDGPVSFFVGPGPYAYRVGIDRSGTTDAISGAVRERINLVSGVTVVV